MSSLIIFLHPKFATKKVQQRFDDKIDKYGTEILYQ